MVSDISLFSLEVVESVRVVEVRSNEHQLATVLVDFVVGVSHHRVSVIHKQTHSVGLLRLFNANPCIQDQSKKKPHLRSIEKELLLSITILGTNIPSAAA